MQDIVTLSCPFCGGKLEISQGIDKIVCAHCGNAHIVHHVGGSIALRPMVEEIGKAKEIDAKTTYEMDIGRLNGEIAKLELEIEAIEQKHAEEIKQLRETKAQLETYPCSVVIIGSLVLMILVTFVSVGIESWIENSGGSNNLETISYLTP